jgi:serine/threonine-protein kinase RsbT
MAMQTAGRLGRPLPADARPLRLPIDSDNAVSAATIAGRRLAGSLGFTPGEQAVIATMISELARNIVHHAQHGRISMRPARRGARKGIVVMASDKGPGITDVAQAMSGRGRRGGEGLLAVKRTADRFRIVSRVGEGTTVTFGKWPG